MDLTASCRDKLAYFRIKELKDVLSHLGMSKQGKKQDLVDRILSVLAEEQAARMWAKKNTISKEEVAKLVDDIYRKMQVSGATDLASKGQSVVESKIRGESKDNSHTETKVRCVCGNTLETDSMIKCEDLRCQVWQHIGCVIIPEKLMDSNLQYPEPFYCEICRLCRADPFWVTVAHPLHPVKLYATNIVSDGSNPMQSLEKTFQLTRADKDLLMKQEYEIQAWCMLLNDKVQFRMQWPQHADLQINGVPVRAINRPGSQLLGINGRDDGPIIKPFIKDGINKMCLSGCDSRVFCVGVRIVKRRTLQQILNLIPKEADGENFEDALARVRRCTGGNQTDNADSDSDIEVVAESVGVNLRCPMSGSRIKVAGRFKPCAHMGCFDLDVFVEMNQRSRKWQCPICLINYSLEFIVIDPYFNRISSKMRHCSEEFTEIEVKPDGSWRVKSKSESDRRELGELAKWHNADGFVPVVETDPRVKLEEGFSDGNIGTGTSGLKLGIRKNTNGFWEVSKHSEFNANTTTLNKPVPKIEHKVIPMSSSGTASRDGEDPSVNQEESANLEAANGVELESLYANFPGSVPNDVIVLTDSDDDNDLINSAAMFDNSVNFPMPAAGIPDHFPVDPALGNSCLGLFNTNDDEFGMPIWSLPAGNQQGPPFNLFNSSVGDALNDPMSSMNEYVIPPDASITHGNVGADTSAEINGGLVDNPLAFEGDPALQIFLPTRPDASMNGTVRGVNDVSSGMRHDDWISLRLGGAAPSTMGQNVPNSGNTAAEEAALLLGIKEGASDNASTRRRSDSPFSFPRQKRSVRPRLFLSIDGDSE